MTEVSQSQRVRNQTPLEDQIAEDPEGIAGNDLENPSTEQRTPESIMSGGQPDQEPEISSSHSYNHEQQSANEQEPNEGELGTEETISVEDPEPTMFIESQEEDVLLTRSSNAAWKAEFGFALPRPLNDHWPTERDMGHAGNVQQKAAR